MRKFRGVSCVDKASRNLDQRCLRFCLADQARTTVTLNFIQLIPINRKIASGWYFGGMAEWPQDRENRHRCHQREYEPQKHLYNPLDRPLRGGSGHTSRAIVAAMSKIKDTGRAKSSYFQARAAFVSAVPATSAALTSSAAYSRPNTLAQKRTAAST